MMIRKYAHLLDLLVLLIVLLPILCSSYSTGWITDGGSASLKCTSTSNNTAVNDGVEFNYGLWLGGNVGPEAIFVDGHVNFGDGSGNKRLLSVDYSYNPTPPSQHLISAKVVHTYSNDGLYEVSYEFTAGEIDAGTSGSRTQKSTIVSATGYFIDKVNITGKSCEIRPIDNDRQRYGDQSEAVPSIKQITKIFWVLATGLHLYFYFY